MIEESLKQVLYVIPGTMCNERLWEKITPYVQEGYRLVHLDIPKGMSFEQLSDHYAHILPEEKANIVGFSLGGYIACDFAISFPQRINRLMVVANSPTALPKAELSQRANTLALVQKHGYAGMNKKRALSMLDPNSRTEELVNTILDMDRQQGVEQFLSQYSHTSSRLDLIDKLSVSKLNVCFFVSENDPLVDSEALNRLAKYSELITLTGTKGSGHYLPLEKPEQMATLIKQWFVNS